MILLDTHVLVWMASEPKHLSRRAREAIREARERSGVAVDRKSTRLNSSHSQISYAVFCLKKKHDYKEETSTEVDQLTNPEATEEFETINHPAPFRAVPLDSRPLSEGNGTHFARQVASVQC